jgi:hypothetical protein
MEVPGTCLSRWLLSLFIDFHLHDHSSMNALLSRCSGYSALEDHSAPFSIMRLARMACRRKLFLNRFELF